MAIEPVSPRIGGDGRLQDGGEWPVASGQCRIGGRGRHTSQRQRAAHRNPGQPPPRPQMLTAHIAASKTIDLGSVATKKPTNTLEFAGYGNSKSVVLILYMFQGRFFSSRVTNPIGRFAFCGGEAFKSRMASKICLICW